MSSNSNYIKNQLYLKQNKFAANDLNLYKNVKLVKTTDSLSKLEKNANQLLLDKRLNPGLSPTESESLNNAILSQIKSCKALTADGVSEFSVNRPQLQVTAPKQAADGTSVFDTNPKLWPVDSALKIQHSVASSNTRKAKHSSSRTESVSAKHSLGRKPTANIERIANPEEASIPIVSELERKLSLLESQISPETAKLIENIGLLSAKASKKTLERLGMSANLQERLDEAISDPFYIKTEGRNLGKLDPRVSEMLGLRASRRPALTDAKFRHSHLTPKQLRLRQKWRDAFQAVITLLRVEKQIDSDIRKKEDAMGVKERKAFVKERTGAQTGLTSILKQAKFSYIVGIAREIREFFQTPQDEITADYDHVELLLNILPSFARMDRDTRKLLVRVMELEVYPANTVVLKQGQDPTSFYFILTGQCEVYKHQVEKGKDVVIPLNVMYPGDAFGEYAITSNTKRTAYVATTMRTELLRVDKEDYLAAKTSEFKYMVFKSFEIIRANKTLSDVALHQMLKFTELQKYSVKSVILKEGTHSGDIYFIKSGTCFVIKAVPLLRKRLLKDNLFERAKNAKSSKHSKRASAREQRSTQFFELVPYDPTVTKVGPNDKVVYNLLKVHTLTAGGCFAGNSLTIDVSLLPSEKELSQLLTAEKLADFSDIIEKQIFEEHKKGEYNRSARSQLVSLAEAAVSAPANSQELKDATASFTTLLHERLQKDQLSYISVIASTDVEIFKTSRVEFAKILTPEILLYMEKNCDPFLSPSVHELQSMYLDQIHWEKYRKHVINH